MLIFLGLWSWGRCEKWIWFMLGEVFFIWFVGVNFMFVEFLFMGFDILVFLGLNLCCGSCVKFGLVLLFFSKLMWFFGFGLDFFVIFKLWDLGRL